MADFLTAHLHAKGGEHSSLATLVNQWGFDMQLIPKALQTVGNMFPHYSRHDESHSKQILVNIERLLGDNIRLLTATDTWLILEAAYWHDIGMVVPQEDVIDACGQETFQSYLEQIRLAPNHELYRFANSFDPRNLSVCFAGADTPFDAVDKFRLLMAEWFRRLHPGRAEVMVQSPWASAGISSPRTELIPTRLFRVLGRICHMHGLPFSEVMAGLSFREAGLAREDCHPRFVACLLRMGDLLDLDDNRFCPVMQRIAGENRPNSSKAHEDKHAGVRHLRLDRERIEIDAECVTIEGYLETFRWFSWIEQELQDQMTHWQDIVPDRSLGLLPTLGRLSVKLSGKALILAAGNRPQFSLDNERAIALLQGANLYSSKYACIRELLQNAVDATLMRLWLLKGRKPGSEDWSSPRSDHAIETLESLPVTVAIRELSTALVGSAKSKWEIVITDQGTGINRDDLGHMLRIGGSQRNLARQSVIRGMPEWMKPSGAFGIGFQSAFMISSEVTLVTKSVYTNEILNVTMFSPTGPKEGLVLVEVIPDDVAREPGTTIKLVIETEAYGSRSNVDMSVKNTVTTAFLQSVDPLLDERFPVEAAQLADQVSKFSERSLIPIRGEMITEESSFKIGSASSAHVPEQATDLWKFLTVGDDVLSMRFAPSWISLHPRSLETFYRGQPFEYRAYFPYAEIGIDLMSGKAGSWLSASRDKLASNAESSLHELVLRALTQQVERELTDARASNIITPEVRPIYSRFLETMAIMNGGKWPDLARHLDRAWLDLRFARPDETFRKFFDGEGGVVAAPLQTGPQDDSGTDYLIDSSGESLMMQLVLRSWVAYNRDGTVGLIDPEPVDQKAEIARLTAGRSNPISISHLNDKRFRIRYNLSKSPQPPYTPGALAARLAWLVGVGNQNLRFLLSADETWGDLWLKVPVSLRVHPLFFTADPAVKFVVLPFLFRGHAKTVETSATQLDKLSSWSVSRVERPSSISQIRGLYERLVKYIDEEVMGQSAHSALWQNARGLSA